MNDLKAAWPGVPPLLYGVTPTDPLMLGMTATQRVLVAVVRVRSALAASTPSPRYATTDAERQTRSRSRKAAVLTQPPSGNPRAHSAAVTFRASCQRGFSHQSRNFRRLARTSVDAPRSSNA